MNPPPSAPPGPVLLFDGECGLCQRIVRLLLRLDGDARVRFAPLQGPAAQALLRARGLPLRDFDSLVWVPDWSGRESGDILVRTDGAIAALRACGGMGRALAGLLAIFPAPWRDAGYRLVARWRYRIFGRAKLPPLVQPECAARFLE